MSANVQLNAEGDVVRVSPTDPQTVLRSTGAGDGSVIGVVSARPGLVLGGAPFRGEELAKVWGEEVAEAYRSRRAALEGRILGEWPDLASRRATLRSPELGAEEEAAAEARWRAADQRRLARQKLEAQLQAATIAAFFEERVVQVALAGRVPVRADASFGAIRPGDPLAASPVPGVAMRASRRGPVLGTAFEGLETGSGTITMLVHRGWYGGAAGSDLARHESPETTAPGTRPATLRTKEAEIAALRRRIAHLERAVARLASDQPGDSLVAAAAPRSH